MRDFQNGSSFDYPGKAERGFSVPRAASTTSEFSRDFPSQFRCALEILLRSRSIFISSATGRMVFACLLAGCSVGAQEQQDLRGPNLLHQPLLYSNPLVLQSGGPGTQTSCPDPAILKQDSETSTLWYLYCTGDPVNEQDRDNHGVLRNHYLAIYSSQDLINWTYLGDVFSSAPSWVDPDWSLWAPAVKQFNGRYYIYYVAPTTLVPQGGSAIGVATAPTPAGPWTDSGAPLIPPGPRDALDPDVVADDSGRLYLSFGSYWGGISMVKLSADAMIADLHSMRQIAIDNRYEAASFYRRDGYYYLFVAAGNCCAGPLSGYTVFVGRSTSPLGPFFDANGVSFLDNAAGGTIVLAANGNRWIGPGGGVVFDDQAGQTWMVYHAIDSTAPWFPRANHFTRRPALVDPVDWVDGWPVVRNGWGASATPEPAPVAQRSEEERYRMPTAKAPDQPGQPIPELSDEFNTPVISSRWRFIHTGATNQFRPMGAGLAADTDGSDENGDPARVTILAEPAPDDDYLVEARVTTSVPFDGSCCYNFAQPTLFIYGDDSNSIKLSVSPNFNTPQTEFGKRMGPADGGSAVYGNTLVGRPAPTTCLRIAVHRLASGGEQYTGYTSADCAQWVRGSTWTHQLGRGWIGISAEGLPGETMRFDYVRVFKLR